jgi:DMSO/TMAO reductase YedYZ molybdopterin-dependent catalytic subunit
MFLQKKGTNRMIRYGKGTLLVITLAILCAVFSLMAVAPQSAMAESATTDVLYDGTVTLTYDETFEVTAYNSDSVYAVNKTTPLGALQAAAAAGGFIYDVTDKNYSSSGALLLDNVGNYNRKDPGYWYIYVNDVYKDGYNNPAGALNLIELVDGDRVEFYYAANITDETDLDTVKAAATASVKTVVDMGGAAPTDWTLQLSGAKDETVTKDYFEQALECSSSHRVSWTDEEGNEWGGMPLWLLVGMVDDDPDEGPYHFNFNDDLSAQNYQVNVISGDGWKATLDSAAITRNNGYIVANTLNGEPLSLKTESEKGCWPLHLKGSAVFGGQQVGNIVRIELSDLPEPSEGWTLEMVGDIGDTITQEEFEKGLACTGSGHYAEWTDKDGNVWSGVPLWVLLGAVDDIETTGHWTFNDDVAAEGYSVEVIAGDGFSKTFNIADVKRSDDYIIANKVNDEPLTDKGPLRLVGDGVAKEDGSLGGSAVGNIARIEIPELQTPEAAPGSWNLVLNGKISDVISQAEFEAGLTCPNSGHLQEWTDGDGKVWSGIPLWFLAGWVDDRQPHKYDYNQAIAGYTILVKAEDGYTKDFSSNDIAKSNDYIIANKCNGDPLVDSWPLRLVGAGVARTDGSLGGTSVGNIVEIQLTSFEPPEDVPEVRIVKYAEDGVTILDEKTVDYLWMENESGFDVIGDGKTVYKYEGITNNPDDIWDADETYPGGFKISNAVKGTRIRDLCGLVGGMGAGTEIVFVARDGFETRLPYSSIYTDPSVQARQGDAILAWYADGKYVPDYRDGMRLFFTPEDCIYGQWDMHETLPENYWHYYFSSSDNMFYPSCAGLSAKWITEIRTYSVSQGDWTLELDGRDIGGLEYDVSKTYFEQALACQFGANHKATYTDSKERVWEGMPLWFLVGFVDDDDQHSNNAFNDELAETGYSVVIIAEDGYQITIASKDIVRNNDYIIANTLDGVPLPETGDDWPLRLVGSAVSGKTSISQIASIKLESRERKPIYTVTPEDDVAYTIGETAQGITTMTVNDGMIGLKYFTVGITSEIPHSGYETAVFTHLRNEAQLAISAIRADFDQENVDFAQAGFNVRPGDVIKVYLVDELNNSQDHNPVILQ